MKNSKKTIAKRVGIAIITLTALDITRAYVQTKRNHPDITPKMYAEVNLAYLKQCGADGLAGDPFANTNFAAANNFVEYYLSQSTQK